MLEEVLADGSRFGLDIKFWNEQKPLSTVGPLRQIDKLSDNFIVANGDVLTDLDLAELYRYHLKSNSRLTVATYKRPTKIDYGVLEVGDDRRATGFREKPVYDFTVSMGIYVFSRSLLDDLPLEEPFGFDDLMYRMLEGNEPVTTYPYDGYWLDIGRPEDLVQANRDIEGMGGKFT
jgi:NDP-sugar pyrophosphorylase family protein